MNNNELVITEFDQITLQGTTQIIKALIPYLSCREQKMIGIMVRIWELIMTLRFFEHDCIPKRERNNNTDLINHIKKYCTPENQKTIDMLLNFMNMSELMKIMNVFDGENNTAGPLDGLFNSFAGGQSEFSMNNLSEIINMFQTMSQFSNDTSTADTKPHPNSACSKEKQAGPSSPSNQPINILQTMMNAQQANLYEEFMEKLNQTMDD